MQRKIRKIYIIGPAGSGKTTLAKKLGKKYNLPVLNLDDIFWKTKYTQENSPEQKQALLQKFLNNPYSFHHQTTSERSQYNTLNNKSKSQTSQISKPPNFNSGWIIEGAPPEFSRQIVQSAEQIIWLNPNTFLLIWRLLKRYFQNRQQEHSPESWPRTYLLLRGVISYKLGNKLYRLHKRLSQQKSFSNTLKNIAKDHLIE